MLDGSKRAFVVVVGLGGLRRRGRGRHGGENLERVEDIVVKSQPKNLHLREHMEVSVPNPSRTGVGAVVVQEARTIPHLRPLVRR